MITIHEADSLSVEVTVAFDAGGPVTSLSGGTAAASVAKGTTTIAGTTAIDGADVVTCSWSAGALAAGTWRLQVVVTIGSDVQTVAEERVRVLPSN